MQLRALIPPESPPARGRWQKQDVHLPPLFSVVFSKEEDEASVYSRQSKKHDRRMIPKVRCTDGFLEEDLRVLAKNTLGIDACVARNVEEANGLVESAFEYVAGEYDDGGKLFRKRK